MSLFVIEQRVRRTGKRQPDDVSYLKEWEDLGALGSDYFWTKDIHEAILFRSKSSAPKLKNGTQGNVQFIYTLVPVQIVPIQKEAKRKEGAAR